MIFNKIKWLLDSIMKDSPIFTGEDEFVVEHEQKVMWKSLKT